MIRREFLSRMSIAASLAVAAPGLAWADALKRSSALLASHRSPGEYLQPLSERELAFIAAIAECIIPATDTGGASAAAVAPFIGYLYSDWLLAAEQHDFHRGLEELAASAEKALGQPFVASSEKQQAVLLSEWDANAFERMPQDAPRPFFRRLKELVVVGYYTSPLGQDAELQVQFGGGQREPDGPVMSWPPFAAHI
jgi:gluconate 2-dehydrogenase gamma chain